MNARWRDREWHEAFVHAAAGQWSLCLDTFDEVEPTAWDPEPIVTEPVLRAQGVGVCVAGQHLLRGVDLCLKSGEVGAVLGPNGTGKSTLLSVLAGLRRPDSGEVRVGSRSLSALMPEALALERAVLPQDTGVSFDFSVQDVVELGRYPHRRQPRPDEASIVQAAMSLTDVSHLAHRRINSLSAGERARVQLARVMAQIWHSLPDGRPRWLLLDEPTAALDLRHQHDTLAMLRRWARDQGVGVLVVLHDLNLALRYADRVWVLHQGRLQANGAPAQVLTPALVARVWQVHVRVLREAGHGSYLLVDGPVWFDNAGGTS